jgi:multiple sugar transport system ATP-binding protein
VAVCRAIVRSPAVFLFDEPLSNLDSQLRATARAEIRALQRRIGTTSVYVTHDQVEAMTMADRIVVMRDGVVQQIGTPLEIFEAPANIFVAGFIGSPGMNLLPAKFADGRLHLGDAVLPLALMGPPRDLVVGLRPEALRPVADAGLSLTIDVAEMLGAECLIHARLGGAPLLLRLPREIAPASGSMGRFGWPPGALHLFEAADGRRIIADHNAAVLQVA